MAEIIVVGISDYKIATDEGVLVTHALGSCVGTCIYDSVNKVMGLSHILLPDSGMCYNEVNIKKFADTAIKAMYEDMVFMGGNPRNFTAKIAGGAQMFEKSNIRIGDRNIEAVQSELAKLNIPIISQDVGENYGRTMECFVDSGKVAVKSISRGVNVI